MASLDFSWRPRLRNYGLERQRQVAATGALEECSQEHPLLSTVVTTLEPTPVKHTKKEGKKAKEPSPSPAPGPADPLSAAQDPLSLPPTSDPLSAALLDPLSQAAAEASGQPFGGRPDKEKVEVVRDVTFEPWSSKRTTILSSFTTSEKIPITTSFLSDEEREKLETKAQAAVGDKVKHRLEQLDDLEEGSVKETLNLSQQDYVKKIDDLNRSLMGAWDNDQRVKALKIAIQCSKLLADTSVIQFYPSKFVLITDILDNFGYLVFDRIRRKSTYMPPGSVRPVMLPEDFTSDQVPESGKETCRNWFFKIASIRELIPRFYVETAILRCYSFLTDQEYTQALIRLTKMVRGIGDPLVAAYGRAYLCRVGMAVAPATRTHLMPNFTDYLSTLSQLNTDHVQNILAVQRLDLPLYLHLFEPAVEWILQCVAHQASEALLDDVMSKIKEGTCSALVLNAALICFSPEYISQRAMQFAELIKDCEETGLPKYKLYASLGNCIVSADPPQKERLPLLNSVWKSVVKFRKPAEYITCTQVWIEYVAKHFSKREVNTLLDDIIKHLTPDRAFESYYPELISVVNKILLHMTDFTVLFSMDKFLPFVDLFQKDIIKVEVCKNVARAFTMNQSEPTSDPVIMNAMMYLCKIMHDSLNALSLEDERRQIGQLICGFLQRISFGRDFEQQLSFYVEARSSFANLDAVLIHLVHSVNWLAMETRRVVKGNHTRKTAAFVRACAAYCFITIPSLGAILGRLNLYLISGRVAVANGALSQGDAFFKAAINSLKDVPQHMEINRKRQSTEPFMASYLNNFLSALLVVPDNPDHEVLYLIRGLLNGLQEYPWNSNNDHRMRVHMNAVTLLSASCQDRYLYGITKVDSNDSLYAGDKKLVAEVAKLVHTILQQVLEHMRSLTTSDELRKRQSMLALGLFARLVVHADISEDTNLSPLLVNLWNLTQKHGMMERKRLTNFHRSVACRPEPHYKALAEKLSQPG